MDVPASIIVLLLSALTVGLIIYMNQPASVTTTTIMTTLPPSKTFSLTEVDAGTKVSARAGDFIEIKLANDPSFIITGMQTNMIETMHIMEGVTIIYKFQVTALQDQFVRIMRSDKVLEFMVLV